SMDIQISSNFERLLFEAHGRDAAAVCRMMEELRQSQSFMIAPQPLEAIRAEFDAYTATEAETTETIAKCWRQTGYLADPHTAVGLAAAWKAIAQEKGSFCVLLGTAHPGKFPAAIERATGVRPCPPSCLSDLTERPENYSVLPNDQDEV